MSEEIFINCPDCGRMGGQEEFEGLCHQCNENQKERDTANPDFTLCESCNSLDYCTDWNGRNLCDECGDYSAHLDE